MYLRQSSISDFLVLALLLGALSLFGTGCVTTGRLNLTLPPKNTSVQAKKQFFKQHQLNTAPVSCFCMGRGTKTEVREVTEEREVDGVKEERRVRKKFVSRVDLMTQINGEQIDLWTQGYLQHIPKQHTVYYDSAKLFKFCSQQYPLAALDSSISRPSYRSVQCHRINPQSQGYYGVMGKTTKLYHIADVKPLVSPESATYKSIQMSQIRADQSSSAYTYGILGSIVVGIGLVGTAVAIGGNNSTKPGKINASSALGIAGVGVVVLGSSSSVIAGMILKSSSRSHATKAMITYNGDLHESLNLPGKPNLARLVNPTTTVQPGPPGWWAQFRQRKRCPRYFGDIQEDIHEVKQLKRPGRKMQAIHTRLRLFSKRYPFCLEKKHQQALLDNLFKQYESLHGHPKKISTR